MGDSALVRTKTSGMGGFAQDTNIPLPARGPNWLWTLSAHTKPRPFAILLLLLPETEGLFPRAEEKLGTMICE